MKKSKRKAGLNRKLIAVGVAACFAADLALANPSGPAVVNGTVSFQRTGNLLQITNSPNAIINWQSFSIGANEITRFLQQSASSAVLNRVITQNPSSILGTLQSNGRVFLINPNGILFGAGAQIDVAGLVASTLNLSNADFLAGRLKFTEMPGAGSVINQGNITTGAGGQVYLVGSSVTNSGIITSPKGEVILAAGNSVELVNPGTPNLRVEISAPDNEARNLGQIVADSGRVGIYAGLINHSGAIRADGAVVGEDGQILLKATKNTILEAGSLTTANSPNGGSITVQSGGTTLVAGTVEAKGLTSPPPQGEGEGEGGVGKGGTVQILGNLVGLTGNASVDVSGATGGGTVLIGGDFQGKNPDIQNAFRTYVGPDATISADAVTNGNGGKVIVWADDTTRFYGSLTARGGAQGGDGGFAEVSGKQNLEARIGNVNLGAPRGNSGTLLLDPADIVITGGSADGDDATDLTATLLKHGAGLDGEVLFGDGAGTYVVRESEIESTDANINLQATNSIAVLGTFNVNTNGEGTGSIVRLKNNRSLTMDTRNAAAEGSVGINLTGVTVEFQTQGIGSITIRAGITGASAGGDAGTAPVIVGALTTLGSGSITLRAEGAVTVSGALTTANSTTSGTPSGNISLTADTTTLTLNNNLTTGNATVEDAMANQTAASGGITLSASTSVTGSGRLITGNAALTGPNVGGGPDNATGGSISVTAGTGGVSGGIGLSSAGNALTIGTASRTGAGAGNDTATAGNITLTSRDEINNGTISTALGVTFGAASGAATNKAGTLSATTTTAAGNVFLTAAGPLTFGASTVAGNLGATAAGAITQSAAIAVTGTSSFSAGANAITLTTATNNFTGAVSLNNLGANNVAITDANAIVLGTSSVGSGTLTVSAAGAITQTGPITQAVAAGGVSITAGAANNITLSDPGNDFVGAVRIVSGNDVTLNDANAFAFGNGGTSAISGNLALTTGGAVTQVNALTVVGTSNINAGANAITLTTATNNLTGAVSLNNSGANDVAITDANDIVLGTSSVGSGTLTVTATGVNTITQTGAITQAASAGAASFTTGGGVITLTQANDFTGAVSATNTGPNAIQLTDTNAIQLGTISTAKNLTVNAVGITQNAEGLTVKGTSTFNAGAGVITLTTATNNFTGAVSLNNSGANNVAVTDANAIVLGTSSVGSGTLTVTATGANSITQTGAITQAAGAGAASFTTGAGAITLTTATNNFTGAVSLNNTGTSDASVTDVNSLTLGSSTVGRNLSAVAGSGLTLAGTLTTGTASGTSIELVGQSFTNTAGGAALVPGAGSRFLVWSSNPNPFGGGTPDNRGGLAYDFKQYDATFGVTTPAQATGNGFLYTLAPTITPGLTGTVTKVYDGTTAATLAAGNYAVSGAIDGDTVTLNNPAVGTYDTKNVGTGKLVTASGVAISSATNGAASVFGYQLSSTTASGNIGDITPASLSVSGVTANNKVYDATTVATLNTGSAALGGVIAGDTVNLSSAAATGTFNNKNVGVAKPVTAAGFAIGSTDAGNYTLTQPTGLTANVTSVPETVTQNVVAATNRSTIFQATATPPPDEKKEEEEREQ